MTSFDLDGVSLATPGERMAYQAGKIRGAANASRMDAAVGVVSVTTMQQAVMAERALIAAWLLRMLDRWEDCSLDCCSVLREYADEIERGEHHG